MLREIFIEVLSAIDDALIRIAQEDYNSYILFIGRADVIPGLNAHVGTDCCIDYQLDRYYDETREGFYLRYLNRNYHLEGFSYEGDSGIDDLSIEMMIYCHLWDSSYFLKSLFRLASILVGNGYQWNPEIPENGKHQFISNNIIAPLKQKNIPLGAIVEKAYSSVIRNAFAHALYIVEVDSRRIQTRTRQGIYSYSFDEFQQKFLYSVILMNKLQNALESNHDKAGSKNTALTHAFYTPDGVKVQVYGEMVKRGDSFYPELRLVKIKE